MTVFSFWLCDGDELPRLVQERHDDVAGAAKAARRRLIGDSRLKKIEIHSDGQHLCSVGRQWMSRGAARTPFAGPDRGEQAHL